MLKRNIIKFGLFITFYKNLQYNHLTLSSLKFNSKLCLSVGIYNYIYKKNISCAKFSFANAIDYTELIICSYYI